MPPKVLVTTPLTAAITLSAGGDTSIVGTDSQLII